MDEMGLSDLFEIRDVGKVFLLCLVFWWIVFALLDRLSWSMSGLRSDLRLLWCG